MKKKKTSVIIIAIVIILSTAFGLKVFLSNKNNVIAVNAISTTKKNLVQSISITGTIKANDFEEIILPSTQKVINVLVEEGQEVKKGQLLVKLDTSDIKSQLAKGKIALDLAKRELEKLKDNDNNTMKKSMENAVKQAELNLQNAKIKYEDAKRRHEQNIKLYEAGFLSKEEIENSKSALKDLEANITNGELALDNAQNSLGDFDDKIYQQEKQIEMSIADQESLEKKIADSNIKSNINGKVVKFLAKKNQYPLPGDSIVIYDLSQYKIELDVSQYDAVSIKEGQNADIKIKGIDKIYTGKVTKIGETATQKMTGSSKETKVLVEITIDDVDEQVKVGYEADIEIALEEKQNSVAVNFEAVQIDEEGNKYIYVIENDLAIKRIVETGLETDFEIEIISGLDEGEKYIANPPEELKEGEAVTTSGGI